MNHVYPCQYIEVGWNHKHMKTRDITECDDFGSEILRVFDSALILCARSKTKHGQVKTKICIETSLRIPKTQGSGKLYDNTRKRN